MLNEFSCANLISSDLNVSIIFSRLVLLIAYLDDSDTFLIVSHSFDVYFPVRNLIDMLCSVFQSLIDSRTSSF